MNNLNIFKQQEKIHSSLKTVLNAMEEMVMILNDHREIVYFNDACKTLPFREDIDILGLRPGEAFRCVYVDDNDKRCGTTEFCKNCGAFNTIVEALSNQTGIRECKIKTSNQKILNFKVKASPLELETENFVLFTLSKIEIENKGQVLEETFYQMFQNMSSGVSIYEAKDGDFVFQFFNKAAERIDGVNAEDLIGKKVTEAFPGVKDFGIFDIFQEVYRTGEPQNFPLRFYEDKRISGWRENYVFRLPSGEIVAIYDDITSQKQAEEDLLDSQKWLKQILNTVNTGILIIDYDTRKITDVNTSALYLFDLEEENVIGSYCGDFIDTTEFKKLEIDELIAKSEYLESHIIAHDGKQVPILLTLSVGSNNHKEHIIVSFFDITKRKQLEEQLKELTLLDDLTQIGNRRAFEITLKEAITESIFQDKPLSTIMVDIDFFKNYNDKYGHLSGDETLKEIANIIKTNLNRQEDRVLRYGGEEFAVILPNVSYEGALVVAERIRQSVLAAEIKHEGSLVSPFVTVSLGVSSRTNEGATNGMELIDIADKQLYLAKESGRNTIR